MASTILVNSIKAQSGTDVNVPTGFKLKVADAGELYIGGVAITTGAQTVLSKTAAYTIVAGDFTGKSSLIVLVDVSAGTSTETVITLPAPADFSTCAIHVVSTAAHGAGNYITVKNSTPTEVYTLYHKGDHCELVSDGTNTLRTGNEFVSVWGNLALTANVAITGGSALDVLNSATSSNYTIIENFGVGFKTATDDFIAPHAGLYRFGGMFAADTNAYLSGWLLKKNSVYVNIIPSGTTARYGTRSLTTFPMSLAKDDSIEFWGVSNQGSHSAQGNASAALTRCTASAWMLRRY